MKIFSCLSIVNRQESISPCPEWLVAGSNWYEPSCFGDRGSNIEIILCAIRSEKFEAKQTNGVSPAIPVIITQSRCKIRAWKVNHVTLTFPDRWATFSGVLERRSGAEINRPYCGMLSDYLNIQNINRQNSLKGNVRRFIVFPNEFWTPRCGYELMVFT